MGTPEPTPRTAAGRALLDRYPIRIRQEGSAEHNAELHAAILAIEAEAATGLREAIDLDAMRVAQEWPTPNHMRTVADALDILTPAKYGDVLRWFANRCDEWVWHMGDTKAAERLEQARAALAAPSSPALDVERLARAIDCWWQGKHTFAMEGADKAAAFIAAAYDSLSPDKQEGES